MMHILSEFDPTERAQLANLMDRLISSIDTVVERLERADESETN